MGSTATELFNACMLDVYPPLAAEVDFGIDLTPRLYSIYQNGIVRGNLTEQDLQEAVADGHKLTAMLKNKMGLNTHVITVWDDLDNNCGDDDTLEEPC
jgi:hypothetical protein